MNHVTVYLAGPITDCDQSEANDWRTLAFDYLAEFGIRGISPLRCEPLIGERYNVSYPDPKFGTARAIASKNLADVRMCDMTLVYLLKELNQRKPSYGSICELAWAYALGKPTILVSDDPAIVEHPVIQANAGWIVDNLTDGLEIAVGIFGDYA